MTFYDVRSSDSSETATTPEQRRKIRSPTPDNDDWSSWGSYTRTKPIPKKDKKVVELNFQHEYDIKSFCAEMERIRADQRRLQTEVSSVRTQSTKRQQDGPFLRRSFMIYRPDKMNSTPNHLRFLTYALYRRRTRLDVMNPGGTVPQSPVTHRALLRRHVITPSSAPKSQLKSTWIRMC